MSKEHRIVLHPGDTLDVELRERLENGYEDHVGAVGVNWQERDRPPGEIATQHRELQLEVRPTSGRVGPVVVTHPQ